MAKPINPTPTLKGKDAVIFLENMIQEQTKPTKERTKILAKSINTNFKELNQMENITRLEVIDETGRKYVRWNCKVSKSIQDNGRTLKLFVSEKDKA